MLLVLFEEVLFVVVFEVLFWHQTFSKHISVVELLLSLQRKLTGVLKKLSVDSLQVFIVHDILSSTQEGETHHLHKLLKQVSTQLQNNQSLQSLSIVHDFVTHSIAHISHELFLRFQ